MGGGGSKKCYLVLGVYAFFLTISTLIGYSSVNGANLGWGRIFAVFLPLYIAIALIVFVAYRILEKRVEEARPFGFYRCSMRKYWLAPFLMLCAVWLTTWLMFWPGSFTSDTTDCIAQALGIKQLSSHHSVVFTFFMLPVVRLGNALGNLELGLAALSFFTVLFLAGVCSYASFWVMQRTRSKLAFLATIAFFALNPVVAQYSISVWKDTYFAGFLLLFCLKLFDLIMVERLEGKTQLKEFLVLGAICLACVLLRNNGLIICLLTMSIACIVLKKARKRLIVICAVVFFAYFAVTGPGYAILNVKQASFAETVGVPIQQLAKSLINNGSLSRENEQYINELMDKEEIEEVFNNRLVDPVKWSDGFNDGLLNDDKRKFIFVWLESMPSNFKSYFVAWRDLTLGYWYAGSNAALVAAPGYYAQGILEESDGVNWPEEAHPDGVNILQLNKITGPETFRSQIDVLRGTRVVGLVFNIAFMAWFAVGVCCWLYCRKAALYIIALLPLLLLWFTMLVAAPAFCQLRYMFSFEIALPFLMTTLCFSFSKK